MMSSVERATPVAGEKLELFVSYSRRDMSAADELVSALEREGFVVTIDRRDLPYGEEWQKELADFIRAADTVVWLVSPDSIESKWCNWELGEVTRLSKRLVPVRIRPIDQATLPAALGRIHVLPAEGVFDPRTHLAALVTSLNTDRAWLKEGTALADRARQWRGEPHRSDGPPPAPDKSALLSGAQLSRAEAWRARQPSKAPAPSQDVLDLILSSREAATKLQRWFATGALAVAVVSASLAGLAWWQRGVAVERQNAALQNESRMLTGLSRQNDAGGDPVTAMLLAMAALPDEQEGIERPYLPEAEVSLYTALLDQRESRVLGEPDDGSFSVQPLARADHLATISHTNVLRTYDLEDARITNTTPGSSGLITAAFWSGDGKRLVAVANDPSRPRAFLWDIETHRERAVVAGHTEWIHAIAFSDDGRFFATAAEDGTARIHATDTGRLMAVVEDDRGGGFHSAAFSRDGRLLATGDNNGVVKLWDWATQRSRTSLSGHAASVVSIFFTANDHRLVTVSQDRTVRIWNLQSTAAPIVLSGHDDIPLSITINPDGTRLLTGSQDDTARLWDVQHGIATLPVLNGHAGDVLSVTFDANGERALTVCSDGTARIWQVDPVRELAVLKGHTGLADAVFTRGGTRVVSAGGGTVRMWEVESLKERSVLAGHDGWVNGAVFSPDGAHVATVSNDRTARLWDARDGHVIATLTGHHGQVVRAAFTGDGTQLITVSRDGSARRWNGNTGEPLGDAVTGLDNFAGLSVLGPGAGRLVTTNGQEKAILWDVEHGRPLAMLKGAGGRSHSTEVGVAEFSADGKRLVTIAMNASVADVFKTTSLSNDATATVWNADTGDREVDLTADGEPIVQAAFRPDGTRVAIALGNGQVRVFNLEDKRQIVNLTARAGTADTRVRGLVFSPDGTRILTTSRAGGQVWDANSGRQIAALANVDGEIGTVRFSPDGRRIATSGGSGGSSAATARVWDAETGAEIAVLAGHSLGIVSMAFDPAGTRLVTASVDRTARVWPVFASTSRLQHHVKQIAPRCLGLAERNALYLGPGVPCWCSRLAKWPFQSQVRQGEVTGCTPTFREVALSRRQR